MPSQSPDQRRAQMLELVRFPDELASLTSNLTPMQLTQPYIPGEWSVAQNVHHVYDSHSRGFLNCKLILTEEEPPLKRYRQDAWAQLADGSSAEIDDSLTMLRALHRRWLRLWESLTERDFARGGWLPDAAQPTTLDDLLALYAGHGPLHADQIRRTLAAGGILR